MTLRADEAEKLSAALGEAARLTAEEAKIKRWAADLKLASRLDVSLRWVWAASCPGYEEVRRRVERLVEAQVHTLIKEAIREAEAEARCARDMLPKVCKPELHDE